MNGAQALMASLVGAGVDVCFMNPGTSEMHFVSALDSVPAMRGVLALFEGVATGAADGYARMAGRPAAVLLHLGPGLANGLANLHNARRAGSPVLTIVGAHATDHVRYDAPLQSDIEALARTVSGWVRTCGTTRDLGQDAVRAVTPASRGQIATLVLPADVSWGEDGEPSSPRTAAAPEAVADDQVGAAADVLSRGDGVLLLLGGKALTERGLTAASRIGVATGARLLAETFPARMERGAGLPAVDRLAYLPEEAEAQLAGVRHLILVGARAPVAFFAYPGRRGDLVPAGCAVTVLADAGQDVQAALERLAGRVAADAFPVLAPASRPAVQPGPLTAVSLASTVAASLPEHAIVADEANTSGFALPRALADAPRHSLLTLTGARSGRAFRWRRARRSPPRTGQWYPWKATVAPCIPSRRCGPRPRAARRHYRADQQRRLRHLAPGTGPHRGRPGRPAGRADARPVRPDPGLHRDQHGPGRTRDPRYHGEGAQPGATARLRRTGAAPDRGDGPPGEDMAGQFGRTPGFFQLYTPTDRDLAASLVSRAEAAGFKGIVVTLDTWITGWRPTWPPAISRSCAGTAWPTTPPTRSAEADLIMAVDGYPSLADLTPDSLRRTCPHHA